MGGVTAGEGILVTDVAGDGILDTGTGCCGSWKLVLD